MPRSVQIRGYSDDQRDSETQNEMKIKNNEIALQTLRSRNLVTRQAYARLINSRRNRNGKLAAGYSTRENESKT